MLEFLKAKQTRLIAEVEGIQKTILGIQAYVGDNDIIDESGFSGSATSEAEKAGTDDKTLNRRRPRSEISMRCREAMHAQTAPWASIALRAYLDTRYPAISIKISKQRLSQEIYAARTAGIIKCHTKALKGGPTTYVTIPPTN